MKTLNNGATEIERSGNTVLAKWGKGYVTWKIDSDGNCYWGHYFEEDFESAAEDYQARAEGMRS